MSTRLVTRHHTTTSFSSSVAPSYTTQDLTTAPIELTSWTSPSSSRRGSVLSSPPPYTASPHTFHPTVSLQIQTTGKPWLSLPLPPKPLPVPIFSLSLDQVDSSSSPGPKYVSIRPERGSGSSYLVSEEDNIKVSTTTYRFGPGKPPIVSLFHPSHRDHIEDGDEQVPWDSFPIQSVSLLSRAQHLQHTRLGTFEWRYASRSERKLLKANSVLVLEKIVRVAVAGGGRDEEVRRTVALLVRSGETRTPGSSASSAGNGGRLMVDLGAWDGEADKTEREMAVVMVVTTALVMLKKEVDRRRAAQIAIMASAASGGS